MLRFAIIKRVCVESDNSETFEIAETEADGFLEYYETGFIEAVMQELKKDLKKGLITRKYKANDIETGLPKAFEKAIQNIKHKTIYVK